MSWLFTLQISGLSFHAFGARTEKEKEEEEEEEQKEKETNSMAGQDTQGSHHEQLSIICCLTLDE